MQIIYTDNLKMAMPLPVSENFPGYLDTDGLYKVDQNLTHEDISNLNLNSGNLEYLGSGCKGVAYHKGNNVVIKITTDPTEEKAAEFLMNKDISCVIKVYCCKKIKESPRMWQIECEKVNKLSPGEEKIVDKIIFDMEHKDNKTYEDYEDEFGENIKLNYKALYFQVKKLCRELYGVFGTLGDIFGPNIGKRNNGELVVLDIGGFF